MELRGLWYTGHPTQAALCLGDLLHLQSPEWGLGTATGPERKLCTLGSDACPGVFTEMLSLINVAQFTVSSARNRKPALVSRK